MPHKDDKRSRYVEEIAALRIDGDRVSEVEIPIIREATVEIRLNGERFVDAQCMRSDLDRMAVGFLVSEGILHQPADLTSVRVDDEKLVVDVSANVPEDRLRGAQDHMKPAGSAMTMDAQRVMALGHEFDNLPGLYKETRCVHSAALSDGERILYFYEDLGRHNAVDKAVGAAFMDGRNLGEMLLLCTGRFPFDMVAKAARAGFPIVISPAAATAEGILLAEKFHITLCGRVRKNSMNIYSAKWRISATSRPPSTERV